MKRFTIIVAVFLLFTGLIDLGLGIAYYQILKWMTTICAGIWAYRLYAKDKKMFIVFCSMAILFNPIVPIFLGKPLWRVVDIISSVIFFYFIKNNKVD